MLDPIVNVFTRIFQWIGRGLGLIVSALLWPFVRAGRWYGHRGWILKLVVGAVLLAIAGLYANFIYATQWWQDFNPDYVDPATMPVTRTVAGDAAGGDAATTDPSTATPQAAGAPETAARILSEYAAGTGHAGEHLGHEDAAGTENAAAAAGEEGQDGSSEASDSPEAAASAPAESAEGASGADGGK